MKKKALIFAVAAVAVAATGLPAQESADQPSKAAGPRPPDHYYKLNLAVEETNDAGKIVNARTFIATVETMPGPTQSIRTGDRVPVEMGSPAVWQYMDLGVDFDISGVKECGADLCFRLGANVSSFATPMPSNSTETQSSGGGASNRPVVRQNKWDSGLLIPIGKPTVVFSADDLQGKGKMQVEVTATRID